MGQDLIKIFEYALNQEKTGMSFFEMSLQRMGIGAAITAFKKIVEEEKSHVRFIEAILRNLRKMSIFHSWKALSWCLQIILTIGPSQSSWSDASMNP